MWCSLLRLDSIPQMTSAAKSTPKSERCGTADLFHEMVVIFPAHPAPCSGFLPKKTGMGMYAWMLRSLKSFFTSATNTSTSSLLHPNPLIRRARHKPSMPTVQLILVLRPSSFISLFFGHVFVGQAKLRCCTSTKPASCICCAIRSQTSAPIGLPSLRAASHKSWPHFKMFVFLCVPSRDSTGITNS